MDTIRTLAEERHFFTAEVHLVDFGHVLLIGDQAAVGRLVEALGDHHELVQLEKEAGAAQADAAAHMRRHAASSNASSG